MKPIDEPHGLCHIDPVSIGTLAVSLLGGLGAGAATGAFSKPDTPAPPVAPPATIAQPVNQPTGVPGGGQQKSQTPTFLGAAATPQPTQSGQKSLLGQ